MFRPVRAGVLVLTLALALAACSTSASTASPSSGGVSAPGLTGVTWKWIGVTETTPAFQGAIPPAEQQNYTLLFNTDGTVAIKADCNSVGGTYTVSGSDLAIKLGPSTLVACPSGSQGDAFLADLAKVASYAIASDALTLTYASNAGTMQFAKS